jgi:hypothetical protein
LSEVLLLAGAPRVAYVQHVEGDGPAFFAAACAAGAEGVVSKRGGSRYRSGPCKDWLKAKRHEIGSFVITAFEEIAPGELFALRLGSQVQPFAIASALPGLRCSSVIRAWPPARGERRHDELAVIADDDDRCLELPGHVAALQRIEDRRLDVPAVRAVDVCGVA